MYTDDTKIRLSIEKATEETVRELKRKYEQTTGTIAIFLKPVISDLLSGIHVTNKIPAEDSVHIIRNNTIEALAAEFPDLVVVEK